MNDLANPKDPVVVTALTHKCEVCLAPTGEKCHNIVSNTPLPGRRIIHFGRVEDWRA